MKTITIWQSPNVHYPLSINYQVAYMYIKYSDHNAERERRWAEAIYYLIFFLWGVAKMTSGAV